MEEKQFIKNNIIFSLVILILGLLAAMAPYTFAKVCELGEKVMKCHWTARIELFLGISIVLLSIAKILLKEANIQLGLNLGIAINSIAVILVPTVLIGVCGKATMHCHSTTKPFLLIAGSLLLLANIVQTVSLWKKH